MRIFTITILLALFGLVVLIFWQQEAQYLLPTPVPENYHPIKVSQHVDLSAFGIKEQQKPILLHFYNPDCPCSRFNIDHFQSLVKTYNDRIDFYAVLQVKGQNEQEVIKKFQETYGLTIPTLVDRGEQLAGSCGVYATPQAVIIDQQGSLYYRGNYNRARYCTAQSTSFAEIALKSLFNGAPPPQFIELATKAYGCQLPSKESNQFAQLIF